MFWGLGAYKPVAYEKSIFTYTKNKNSVSLGTDPPLSNHNPVIFSIPPGTEKHISPPGKQKILIISMCCTCLTIPLILTLEQPTKTS